MIVPQPAISKKFVAANIRYKKFIGLVYMSQLVDLQKVGVTENPEAPSLTFVLGNKS